MLALTAFYQLSAAVFFTVFTYPNLSPDPALVVQLEQARGAVHGENGYAALFDLPVGAAKTWPEEVPRCNDDTVDCLALARAHLAAWQAVIAETRAQWQQQGDTINRLRDYDYFRPQPGQYGGDTWPSFRPLIQENTLHAYRFAAGERDAALQGACRDASLGLKLMQSHNMIMQSVVGATLLRRNLSLLAEMRAELPADAALPAACDALQAQPAETFALCPLMYGEWMTYREDTRRDDAKIAADAEESAADKAFYFTLMRQAAAQRLYDNSRYCAPEILAAIARDELRVPQQERWPRYCSPINPVCRFAWVDLRHLQSCSTPTRPCRLVTVATAAVSPSPCTRKAQRKARKPSPCRYRAAVCINGRIGQNSSVPFFVGGWSVLRLSCGVAVAGGGKECDAKGEGGRVHRRQEARGEGQ